MKQYLAETFPSQKGKLIWWDTYYSKHLLPTNDTQRSDTLSSFLISGSKDFSALFDCNCAMSVSKYNWPSGNRLIFSDAFFSSRINSRSEKTSFGCSTTLSPFGMLR